ncbi:efflux RND transporter permease subunit [Plantibacter sp. M259]|uniref:efflux RND transporter permease subunit n=1 Tax=Plantibacter sp. M259 TaxID=2583822 RepID=UPI00197C2A26|nr:efflux RND transporter permease subunit [Plantibacter sp. M259]
MFLTQMSLKNRLLVGLITIAVAALGVLSMGKLKQEMMPPTTTPMAFVSVQVEGIAPEEMSRIATVPLETALQSVPNVKNVSSTTSTGSSNVIVEWPFENDADETLRAVKAAADGVKSALPATAQIDVFSGSNSEIPAMQLSAGSSGDQDAFGDALAQKVVPALKNVPGVQKVELAGREEQRIVIDLRQADVNRLRVDPTQLGAVLEAHGAAVPAGQADSPDGSTSISVGTATTSLEDLQNLPVKTEAAIVALKEFADVHVEKLPTGSLSRVNGKPSLTITVSPAQGANVVQISHVVNAELDRLAPSLKAEFVTLFDQAPVIEQSIHDLSVEGGLGLLFAVIVILVFLGSWRSTVIAAISIPLSLLITMIGLFVSNNTLNTLTLGALTIAIGRVVDDSIVVIENISRRAETDGLGTSSIIASVRQVAGAITASTLTTVAVFLPIVFVSGAAGQLFRPFAVTVSIALLASLLVSLTIVPVLAAMFMRMKHQDALAITSPDTHEDEAAVVHVGSEYSSDMAPVDEPITTASSAPEVRDRPVQRDRTGSDSSHVPEDRLQRAIMPSLRVTRRHPVITLVASGMLLAVTLGMGIMIPTDFLGSSGNETLELSQSPGTAIDGELESEQSDNGDTSPGDGAVDPAPEAAPAEDESAAEPPSSEQDLVTAATEVEEALKRVQGVKGVLTSIPVGEQQPGKATTISYTLRLEENTDVEQVRIAVQARLDKMPKPEEFRLLTQDAFVGDSGAGGGIDLRIQGNDPAMLKEASVLLQERLKSAAGIQTVYSELEGGQSIVRVKLDEVRAGKLGFDRASVAKAIQDTLQGAQIGSLMLEGEKRPIVLRTPGTKYTAAQVGEILLPVTAEQTSQAQKVASDALEARAQAEADAAKRTATAEVNKQIAAARQQRADATSSIASLQQQLAALAASPVEPRPEPDEQEKAAEERQTQLAELQSAIANAEASITAADEQIAQLYQSQRDTAAQEAEAKKAADELKAVTELRGTPLKVSDIATVENELVPPMISRDNGERTAALTVTPEKGKLSQANASVQDAIQGTQLPAGVTFDIGGVSEQQDEAFSQLGMAMIMAIMLVLIVMIATFRSFRQPFVLLVSIPFAATGAILGLLLTGTPLGLPALIGLLMLVGIVVTNAIVLMDLINRFREEGSPLDEAVTNGTRLRLRPILMTAAATIFALVPMSLGLTGGGAFISRPLAIVVIGGLLSSTLLTLILVPILYTWIEHAREQRIERRTLRRSATLDETRTSSEHEEVDAFERTLRSTP